MQEEETRIEDLPSGGNGDGNEDGAATSPGAPFGVHSIFQIGAPPPFEPILDTEEAAALLKIHPKTLQKLARNGTIPGFRIGKLWGFRASALNRWLERKTSP